jgi:glucose-6-phosphate isomerase
MAVRLQTKYVEPFIREHELFGMQHEVEAAHKLLEEKTGLGNDYLGWVNLPRDYDKEEFSRIKAAAKQIQKDSDVLVVIGIGGSYLGARAAIELLTSPMYNLLPKQTPNIYFAGNSISPTALQEIIKLCEGKDISLNVISKSGTTTEPALAFRVFREIMEKKYGEDAKKRIYVTTDKARGTLKKFSDEQGYQTFVIPDDVGGRYSVLTAVGLLPIAVAGVDIDQIMQGALNAMENLSVCDLGVNDCYRYAALRNILGRKGKSIELLVSYEPAFTLMNEWYKQLFGESEGKDHKGIFPASVVFSTDLHSMGQFIQDGSRILFETVVDIKHPKQDLTVQEDPSNVDGLNFLTGMQMSYINQKAMQGTILAHTEGGTPNLVLEIEEMNPFAFGYLVYFFEKACAISGYLSGINPFDQPGVEGYKTNMFALLGKPGYEDKQQQLLEKLK